MRYAASKPKQNTPLASFQANCINVHMAEIARLRNTRPAITAQCILKDECLISSN